MSAARVLGTSVACRNKPQVPASTMWYVLAIVLLALSALHVAEPVQPEAGSIASDAAVAGPVRHIETEVSIPDPEDLRRMIAVFAVTAAIVLLLGAFFARRAWTARGSGPLERWRGGAADGTV